MRRGRPLARALLGVFVLAGAVRDGLAQQSERQPATQLPSFEMSRSGTTIRLTAGKSVMFSVPYTIRRIAVAEPKVADVVTISERQFLMTGKKAGVTNILVWDERGRTSIFDLLVQADAEALAKGIKELYPEEPLRVRAVKDTIVLSGVTARPGVREIVGQMAEAFAPNKVVNLVMAPELSSLISPGMRAVTVRVNDVIGVAGFLVPGSRVDVLTTIDLKKPARTVTKMILQGVMVLTTGTRRESKKGKTQEGLLVTLLVNPSQAERLTLASIKGTIHLTLQSGPAEATASTKGVTPRQLIYGSAPKPTRGKGKRQAKKSEKPRPAAAAKKPAPPKPERVKIFYGTTRSN